MSLLYSSVQDGSWRAVKLHSYRRGKNSAFKGEKRVWAMKDGLKIRSQEVPRWRGISVEWGKHYAKAVAIKRNYLYLLNSNSSTRAASPAHCPHPKPMKLL